MARCPDASLVALATNGNKDAFAELIVRHRPTAMHLTLRLLRDHDLATDAVQEAVVVALVGLSRLRRPDRFGSWLCGIALNIARRWLRQSRLVDQEPVVDHLADGERTEDLAEASMIAGRIREAIDELPPGQRNATLLFYLEGLSHRETAAELEISVGAVKSRLHQARRTLAPSLAVHTTTQEVPPMSDTTTPAKRWVEVTVADVRSEGDDTPLNVVILQDQAGRQLPIWIGRYEATALAVSLESVEMPRPLTYEFTAGLLEAASTRVVEVRVTQLVEGVFYAVVALEGPAGPQELDARPSDALNLALVSDSPIRVAADIFDDPKAMDRTEWREYDDTASQLVGRMRAKLEQVLALREDQAAQ